MIALTSLHLPLLEPHRDALEKCVYCPKLSRASCPVSNVEASETVTPWGKMSMAYFAARGDVPIDEEHAAPAWACSACMGCRERCDHKNDVAKALVDARAELFTRGAAPAGARRVAERHAEHARRHAERVGAASAPGSGTPVLVGCGYHEHAPDVAAQALSIIGMLRPGATPRPLRSCCALGLHFAGDRGAFTAAANALAAEVAGATEVVVVDPGCAHALAETYPRLGVTMPKITPFVDVVVGALDRLEPGSAAGSRLRYHDPCALGRGLGRYDEPRAILARATGEPAQEFQRSKAQADCSGGGGLLPSTRPATSRSMAEERLEDHHKRGGGTVVTACAQSLRRFRASGNEAVDLVSVVAQALARRS